MTNPSHSRHSSRRDFLKGRASIQAVRGVVEDALGPPTEATYDRGVPRPTALDLAEPAEYLLTVSRRAMACTFEVHLPAAARGAGTEAALAALDLIDELETQMTVYRQTSEVVEINRSASVGPVEVERRLFGLLELARTISEETSGAFDVTSGPLSDIWGFSRRKGRLPDIAELEEAKSRVGYQQVVLHADSQRISFSRPGVTINLNGIGKGYALDRAAEFLEERGLDHFLLHGGNSSVLGRVGGDETDWRIGVRHPLRPTERLGEILIGNRAVGTSGSGTQYFRQGGKRFGHILDPRTGWPAEGVLSATVVAPSCAEADALATAFYVMGAERAEEFCGRHPQLGGVLVCPGKGGHEVDIRLLGEPKGWWRPR